MAATLLAHAIAMSNERKLDKEAFKNGISYFSGPLLNWTLVGVIKALVRESSQKACDALHIYNLTLTNIGVDLS